MSFIATSFMFDETPGELYNLYLARLEGGGVMGQAGTSDVELRTQSIFKRPAPYLLGVSDRPVLEFEIEMASPDEVSAEDAQLIQRWLFGRQNYKKLQIIQEDMQSVYFNCFLTQPRMVKVGGMIHGFKARVVCDSPFAWEFEKTLTKTYTDPEVSDSFVFNNTGDMRSYLYVNVVITMNNSGGDLTITNTNDNDREFTFTGLSADEVLTVNNDLKILTSSTGLRRLSTFNKNWLRVIQGVNTLEVVGNVASLVFTYSFPRKIGG